MPRGLPYRTPARQGIGPNTQPYVPTSQNARVTNTVSVTGSVTSSITGTVTVNGTVTSTYTVSTSLVTAQVSVTTASTLLFATGSFGSFRQVRNTSTTSAVFIGVVGVTITTGHSVPAGATFDMERLSAPLYGIVSTGSEVVTTIGWA